MRLRLVRRRHDGRPAVTLDPAAGPPVTPHVPGLVAWLALLLAVLALVVQV